MVFSESANEWTPEGCITVDFQIQSGNAIVDCDCTATGHITVFLVQTDGTKIELPDEDDFHYKVTIEF